MAVQTSAVLARLLRDQKTAILDRWEAKIRGSARARPLSKEELHNGIPKLLDEIAQAIEHPERLGVDLVTNTPAEHARHRLDVGYDLATLLREYAVLRSTIFDSLLDAGEPFVAVEEIRGFARAIDEAVIISTSAYATARLRVIGALDRLSQEAIGRERIEDYLPRLLRSAIEWFADVDIAAIFLGRPESLIERALVKNREQVDEAAFRAIAVRFADEVARDGHSRELVLHDQGLKSLYAVPLFHGRELIGVAVIGSRTAERFSDEDTIVLRMMCERASSALLQRERENVLALLDAAFSTAPVAVAFIDLELRVMRKNEEFDRLPAEIAQSAFNCARGLFQEKRTRVEIERENWHTLCTLLEGPGNVVLGASIVVTDISERKHAEERARFTSEVSTRLAQTLSVQETFEAITKLAVPRLADWCAIDILRDDGAIGEPAAIDHVDPSKVEIVRELRTVYPPDPASTTGIFEVIRSGQPLMISDVPDEMIVNLARDEHHLQLLRALALKSILVVPVSVHGKNIGALSLAIAQSERKIGPQEREMATELAFRASFTLANARLFERAQEAVRLRESVLAVVSHDLKNPLGVIMMSTVTMSRLAARSEGNDKMAEVSKRIHRAAERMHRLINDLVDFASVQAGRLAIVLGIHDPAQIVHDAAETIALGAEEGGVHIVESAEPGLPPVHCDRDRVLQVLSNVLSNAIKVTPAGGRIEISAARRGDEVLFSVRDTGPGVPEEDRVRIFERYYRAEAAQYKGSGLGLAIAKGLVEAHGGRIWADGAAGGGAVFSFTVPIAKATSGGRVGRDRG